MRTIELPNKLYFRIGEVAKIVDVKPYVLRYWETEFSVLKPGKTPSRHRLYRRRDVETLLVIKNLLYEEGFTIAGAKKRLKEGRAVRGTDLGVATTADTSQRQALISIHQQLVSLYNILDQEPT